jgi:rod shape-determining protein MreC
VFKVKNRPLIFIAVSFALLLVVSSFFVPSVTDLSRNPLILFKLFGREVNGIIFYHRNFINNARLNNENYLLRQRLNTLQEASLENERLKKLLALKDSSSFKVIACRVIGRSADSWASLLIIDKGSYHGIKRGMPVISYLGLLGRVSEAGKFTSKVTLISDPGLGVSGIVQRSRQEGLVSGTLGANLLMRYLPQEPDIKVGDAIVSSGLNDIYPEGLLIGTVVDVSRELSGLNPYAVIKPAINLSNIEEVLVVVQ